MIKTIVVVHRLDDAYYVQISGGAMRRATVAEVLAALGVAA